MKIQLELELLEIESKARLSREFNNHEFKEFMATLITKKLFHHQLLVVKVKIHFIIRVVRDRMKIV